MKHDELAQYLDSLKREECYRVDALLKESAHETTQRVYFVGENGAESGPFIRKFIQQEAGLGSVYQRVFEAQQSGHRFKYIPDILECYARDGQLVVVMEYVHGDTLQELIYQNDPSLELAQQVFPQICDAVNELHTEFDPPIIHRDLKPSNIILTGQGLALIDFGISREYHEQADCDTTHFGTREFAPPEQFGFGQTGIYSDVYSLGMVLYYCLTEQIPSPRARKVAFADSHIPEPVRKIIERACSLDPNNRFACVGDFKSAFLDAVSATFQMNGSQQVSQAQRTGVSRKKGSPARLIAIGASAIVLMVVVAFGAYAAIAGVGGKSNEPKNDQAVSTHASSIQASSAVSSASTASAQSSENSFAGESVETSLKIFTPEDMSLSPQQWDAVNSSSVFTESAAGVEFEVPSYYKMKSSKTTDGMRIAFPEEGSSIAMIMFAEQELDENSTLNDREIMQAKDSFVASIIESNKSLLSEVSSSTDYNIGGYPARMVVFNGSVNDLKTRTMIVLFLNPDSKKLGAVLCCESNYDQLDYSTGFSRVVTSAKRVNA